VTAATEAPPAEQTRARYPDEQGFIEREGVHVFWESYGEGEQTILFLPTWTLLPSRVWKAQIGYFARHFRVVCFDPRGNGRSDRPGKPSAYAESEFAQDAIDVMDGCGVDRAVCVALSRGAQRGLLLAAEHPERVAGIAFIGPFAPLSRVRSLRWRALAHPRLLPLAMRPPITTRGWAKFNMAYWSDGGYGDFVRWWAEKMLTEPHSTKQIEDAVAWGLETDPETLIATSLADGLDEQATREIAARVECPVLVIHGEDDAIRPIAGAAELAALTGARFMRMPGVGHCPQARKPVAVNLALREFVENVTASPPQKEVVHGHS
jgi:pimeloyl-ACP methyl ester carboxylesterase